MGWSAISEIFLEALWRNSLNSLEETVNLMCCLMNIQKKIQDAIHSIQNLSIIAACSRTHYRLGPLKIPTSWSFQNKKQFLNSFLEDLEKTVLKLISFQDDISNLSSKITNKFSNGLRCNYSSDSISESNVANQCEWVSYDSIRSSLSKTRAIAEDNLDSIYLLRYLVLWDYENGSSVGT
jgi:methyl-accepting chemotaxis protein